MNIFVSTIILLPALNLTLSACESGLNENRVWERDIILFSNSDDMFYAADATGKAVNLFLGGPTNDGPNLGRADGFSSSGSTVINRISGFQIGVESMLASPLTPRLSLTASGAVSIGETTLLLPDGAGILVEPITIRFNSLQAETQIGLRQNLPITERVAAAFSANIGMKAAISTTHINSPVIALVNNTTFTDPFIGAEIEISASPASYTAERTLSLGVELRYYRTTGNTVSAKIGLKF